MMSEPLAEQVAPVVKTHSRLGMVSVGAVLFACCATAVGQMTGAMIGFLIGRQGYANYTEAIQRPEFQQYAALAGILGLCQLGAIPLVIIGLLAAIGGLFEPERRKELPIVGIVLNGIVLIIIIILVTVGFIIMSR